jgi:hypothetical protein
MPGFCGCCDLSASALSSQDTIAATTNYEQNISRASESIAIQQLSDGAILTRQTAIIPYFSNLAAIGLSKTPGHDLQVQRWMQWYINHLNNPDKWGLNCTVYDYSVIDGKEKSKNNADSTDSYAATFASLTWSFWNTNTPDAQAYIKTVKSQLNCIGTVMVQTMQPNGLTWAKPDYKTFYLMDNCEVYQGFVDLANLFEYAFNDRKASDYYKGYAEKVRTGIQKVLWDPSHKNYLPFARSRTTNWKRWYPDATAQLFPILNGVLAPSDPRAKEIYARFNRKWPEWPMLSFPGTEPWVIVACAAAIEDDSTRATKYIISVHGKFRNPESLNEFQSAELGWFIRLNNYMLGHRPL